MSELCSIMKKCDTRVAYFEKIIEKHNRWKEGTKKVPHKEDCDGKKARDYQFPFGCSQCHTFVWDISYGIPS